MNPNLSVDERKRLLLRVTNVAVLTAFVLAWAKLLTWYWSGSIAVLASSVDSVLDVSASLFNALAVRYAMKPADAEHRFGHGKSEAFAGLMQALLIGGSAGFILHGAVERWYAPRALEAVGVSLLLMALSLAATCALVVYQQRVVQRTGSTAVKADSFHYATDVASNAATLVALAVAPLGWIKVDPALGAAIALLTAYTALTVGWESVQVLMDRELPDSARESIRHIALRHPQARGIHDLRTRSAGPSTVIQFHLELDPLMSVDESNRVVHQITSELIREFPGADVIVHQDPAGGPHSRDAPAHVSTLDE
jgi:ferrous-iron efflux pump FieF